MATLVSTVAIHCAGTLKYRRQTYSGNFKNLRNILSSFLLENVKESYVNIHTHTQVLHLCVSVRLLVYPYCMLKAVLQKKKKVYSTSYWQQ